MLQLSIIAVGQLKEKYWRDAAAEYTKRLSRYCRLEVFEVPDEATERLSPAQETQVRQREGERILQRLRGLTVLMDIGGTQLDSPQVARQLHDFGLQTGSVTFVIGGSLGVSRQVRYRADQRWSFSPMTFPHQLARIMLLEQIYRGFRIDQGEPYHK